MTRNKPNFFSSGKYENVGVLDEKKEGIIRKLEAARRTGGEILGYPFSSFSTSISSKSQKNPFPCYQMLTSLLGVRSSLFCCSSWPELLRSPLLPSRCSPRCKASTLEKISSLVFDKRNCVLHVCSMRVVESMQSDIVDGSWKVTTYLLCLWLKLDNHYLCLYSGLIA